ncbi:MAG TPA: oligosaccharide flippase family protein [Kofleriaceae bacterium]|nr:oligosaccharide flippase family protein [Kofleriaceae bacterium]
MASLDTKVARGVAWAASAQAVIAVADLISQIAVTVFFISPSDLGIAFAAIPFYTALDYIADAGVGASLIQRDDHTPERISTVFWFNLLISGALFVALLGLGPLYGWIQDAPVLGWLLIAYGGKLILQNAYAIPFALLRKELRFDAIAKARVTAHLTESISRVVFAAMGATVWCWTFAALARSVVFAIAVQIQRPFAPKLVFQPREVGPYIKFGLRTAASNVLYQLYTSMDAPIIFHFFGRQALGIYALADSIVLEPVKMIANVVIDVAFPTFARLRTDTRALGAQLVKLTRLNLIAVLPYTIVVLLVIPEILRLFWLGDNWSATELAWCADAARILCVMGFFRALGFLGPPLLDGVGKPELTLRYMIVATIAVPGSFLLGAVVLGDQLWFLSVAVAWAIGYPIAFAALAYLVARTIELDVTAYLRGTWGVIACCAIGTAIGFATSAALPNASDVVRLLAIAGSALAAIGVLLGTWQKITPRSIASALR